jgi:hypothetical protein
MVSAEPAVREGLLRFVREVWRTHAASWSAAFWPEMTERRDQEIKVTTNV